MQANDSNIPAFPAFPCPARYVALGAIEDAVSRVSRAIDAREAAALVIGPPGTGKSLLCGLIASAYQPTHKVVVLGETPLDNRDSLLRHLLHRLGVNASDTGSSDTGSSNTVSSDTGSVDPHLALVDYINQQDSDAGLIIIVDEAQKLSADLIESIRMVTNITRDQQPRVFALLCGGVKLDETLVDSSLESFTQRAATRCYLHPMNSEESRYYVHETIRACGAEPESTITDEAIAAIHHACSGVPRLINQLISQAIDCAAEADETLIAEQFVDQAWSELQQLPSPMVEEPQLAAQSSPIEFGELDESAGSFEPEAVPSTAVEWTDEPSSDSDCTEPAAIEFESNSGDLAPRYGYDEPSSEFGGSKRSPDDIQLESDSAVWIDEPAEDMPTSPEYSNAQSNFSEEHQSVELFGSFDHEEEISVGSGFAAVAPLQPKVPNNLESLLQQEIVGAGELVDPSEQTGGDVIQMHDDEEHQTHRDDSDLLIIEDEVAVIPIDSGDPNCSEPQSIRVDFQAMLTKMRGDN